MSQSTRTKLANNLAKYVSQSKSFIRSRFISQSHCFNMPPSPVTCKPYRCRYQLPPSVAKEAGKRIDTSKNSFLTLPGEIRNIILDHLLVRSKCYLLINVRNSAKARSRLKDNGDFGKTKGLIFSCRQIYHEATTMFFMENRFDMREQGDEHGYRYFNNHVRQAGEWLQSLGSQLPLLRRVTIDTPFACGYQCHEGDDHDHYFEPMVPVSTIVQAYWTSPVTTPLNLSLEIAPSFQSIEASSHDGSSEQDSGIDYRRLTNIVKTLAHDKDLDIRKSRLAIKDIKIDGNCRYGYIYWKRSRPQRRYMES
jgi:hypothetical protein